jgi:hypothetical protein
MSLQDRHRELVYNGAPEQRAKAGQASKVFTLNPDFPAVCSRRMLADTTKYKRPIHTSIAECGSSKR